MRGPANAQVSSIRRRIPRRLTRFDKGDTYEESRLAHHWELSRSRPCARRSGSRCGTQARRYRTESETALAAGRALRRPSSRGSSRRNRRARRGGSDPSGSRLVRPSRRARQQRWLRRPRFDRRHEYEGLPRADRNESVRRDQRDQGCDSADAAPRIWAHHAVRIGGWTSRADRKSF